MPPKNLLENRAKHSARVQRPIHKPEQHVKAGRADYRYTPPHTTVPLDELNQTLLELKMGIAEINERLSALEARLDQMSGLRQPGKPVRP